MKTKTVLRSLFLAYGLTGVCLLLLAFLAFQFDLGLALVSAGIVAVYVISCLAGGFFLMPYYNLFFLSEVNNHAYYHNSYHTQNYKRCDHCVVSCIHRRFGTAIIFFSFFTAVL